MASNATGIDTLGKGLQCVSVVADDFNEVFVIPSIFYGKLFPVSGVLELESNISGKWRVKAKMDRGGIWRFYGNGWRNFVEDNFRASIKVIHFIRINKERLYVTGYDGNGREINVVNGNDLRTEKCCIVGDDLPSVYQPIPIDYFERHIDETMQEVCFLIGGTYYPSDISYSKDETFGVNVGVAVSGEAWEILCQDYDFRKGHVMIIWHKNIDLFGGKIFHSQINNIYGIANTWPEYIHDDNDDAIGGNADVFDASIEQNMAMEKGVIIPEQFMWRHKIRGHVAAKLRYKGQPFKMKLKMSDTDILNKNENPEVAMIGDWIGFINDNGIVMHSTIEDGIEVFKTMKLIFHLHTETVRNEYAIMFDVYDF